MLLAVLVPWPSPFPNAQQGLWYPAFLYGQIVFCLSFPFCLFGIVQGTSCFVQIILSLPLFGYQSGCLVFTSLHLVVGIVKVALGVLLFLFGVAGLLGICPGFLNFFCDP